MRRYLIKGGIALEGEVVIGGSKNAALGILAASIMTDDTVTIGNLPDVSDIDDLLEAIKTIGVKVNRIDSHTVKINSSGINATCVDSDCVRRIRGSYYLMGALLGRFKEAQVSYPGGCNIGTRPIEQHVKGFEALGAEVKIAHGIVHIQARELVGNHMFMDKVSVGATINIMIAATLAKGTTIIENAAKEPHVVDVANFLNNMGASVKGAGTDVIRIKGVDRLHGSSYTIIQDQIEAGTFMVAAAATRGSVVIKNVIPKHLEAITAKLKEVGVKITEGEDSIHVTAGRTAANTQIRTMPYPGFPTDMQPQISTLLAITNGKSNVTESIFENRFKYVDELVKMGANVMVEGTTAIIEGVDVLTGATINAHDLRAGAALVIAGLAAEGLTIMEQVEYIERGYELFVKKLCDLGAHIEIDDTDDEKAVQRFKLKEAC